jgi:HK97 family phage major capsid protein
LIGYPYHESEYMPAIASNSLSLAFANWKEAYTIVDRTGIRILRDPFTAKPYIVFYATKRVGGAVLNFDAIKFFKFAAA